MVRGKRGGGREGEEREEEGRGGGIERQKGQGGIRTSLNSPSVHPTVIPAPVYPFVCDPSPCWSICDPAPGPSCGPCAAPNLPHPSGCGIFSLCFPGDKGAVARPVQGPASEAAVSMEYPVLNQQSLQDSRTIRGTMKSLLLLLGLLLLGSPGQGRDSEQGLASQEVSDKELQGEWGHRTGPGCASLHCVSLGWHCPPDSFWGPPALGSLIPEHSDAFSSARLLSAFPPFWLRCSVEVQH